jgi:hypothetical protein
MHRLFVPLVLILAILLPACGSSAPTAAPVLTEAPAIFTQTPAAPAFPTGRFIKIGSTTDYGLQFNRDGTFTVFEGANTFVNATYKVENDVLTETSNTGGCKTNVSFYYTFDGASLTLSYVGDPRDDMECGGRYADFNKVTYILAKK